MEKIKKNMCIKIIILIVYMIITFLFRDFIFKTQYNESVLMLHLCFISTYLITLNSNLVKSAIYQKKVNYIKLILVGLAPIVIYFAYEIIRKLYLPHNWLTTNYANGNYSFTTEILDFLFLYKAYGYGIRALVLADILWLVFSAIVLIPTKEEETKKIVEIILAIFEKIGKIYLKYRFFIVFIMAIYFAPQMYIYIRSLTYMIIATFFIIAFVYIYIYCKSIIEILKSDKNKKLVLLVTLDNFDFNLLREKNALNEFSKYRPSKSLNNLAIDSKRCLIARYELVRYKIIDISDYKDVSYIVYYENRKINKLSTKTIENFEKEIENINGKSEKLVIIEENDYNNKNSFSEKMKEKYKDDFYINVSAQKVLENLLEREENTMLKKAIKDTIENIKLSQKGKSEDVILANKYIINSLKNINTSDATRSYYTLMKICEYIVHYRALKLIAINENGTLDSLAETSFGKWIQYQKTSNEKIKTEEISVAIKSIKEALFLKDTIQYSYDGICTFISSIRNKTIGHGALTYMIAKKIVNKFYILTEVLINEFIKSDYILDENDYIKNVFEEDVRCIIKEEDKLCLYSFAENGYDKKFQYEYLNYETGKIINHGNLPNIVLNYKIGVM